MIDSGIYKSIFQKIRPPFLHSLWKKKILLKYSSALCMHIYEMSVLELFFGGHIRAH